MSTVLTGQMLYYGQKMSQKRPPKIIFIVKSSADCFFQLISSSFAPKAQDDKIRCLILSDNTYKTERLLRDTANVCIIMLN